MREHRFWSQEELAERAGVSRATIYKAEGGAGVAPKTGRALAEALGVPPEDLLPKAEAPSASGQRDQEEPIFRMARRLALQRAQQDQQAENRARESAPIAQTYRDHHYSEMVARLEGRSRGELAEGYADLMQIHVLMEKKISEYEQELAELRERITELEAVAK